MVHVACFGTIGLTVKRRDKNELSTRSIPPPSEPAAAHSSAQFLSKLMPELSVVGMLLWVLLWPGDFLKPDHERLLVNVFFDAGTMMFCATLVDVASRLKRPLAGWWLVAISIGLLLVNPYMFFLAGIAWSLEQWIFVPFAWSLIERLRELYTLPNAPVIEKLRRRTLTFDRLYTALILAWLCVAGGIVNALQNDGSMELGLFERALPWLMLVFYSVAALNVCRVHGPSFANRPRSLWPWIDRDGIKDLGPL